MDVQILYNHYKSVLKVERHMQYQDIEVTMIIQMYKY